MKSEKSFYLVDDFQNKPYFEKGGHLLRGESFRNARNLRGIPPDVVDLLSCNIPLTLAIKRSMRRPHPSGKR